MLNSMRPQITAIKKDAISFMMLAIVAQALKNSVMLQLNLPFQSAKAVSIVKPFVQMRLH